MFILRKKFNIANERNEIVKHGSIVIDKSFIVCFLNRQLLEVNV